MKVAQILILLASLCCLFVIAQAGHGGGGGGGSTPDCGLDSVTVYLPAAVDGSNNYCPVRGENLESLTFGSHCGSQDDRLNIQLAACAPDGRLLLRAYGSSSLSFTVQTSTDDGDVQTSTNYDVSTQGSSSCGDSDYYAPITVGGNGTDSVITTIDVVVSGDCRSKTYYFTITNDVCTDSNYCVPESIDVGDALISFNPAQLLQLPVVNVLSEAITESTISLTFNARSNPHTYYTIAHSTQDPTTLEWSTPVVAATAVVGTTADDGVSVAWSATLVNKYIVSVSTTGSHACSFLGLTILLANPTTPPSGLGDPQFVGLRGQSFQVHGYDGAVFNIITNKHFQLHALFVFLTGPRPCPIMPSDGEKSVACWSHDGSYLGDLGLKTNVDDQLYVKPGSAATGFDLVEFNNRSIGVGETVTFEYKHTGILVLPSTPTSTSSEMNQGKIQRISSHELTIEISSFTMEIENVDGFVNVRRLNVIPESRSMSVMHSLGSHGLLGQTWQLKRYNGKVKEIEGDVNDYVVVDGLFGNQFVFNQLSSV